MRGMVDLKFGNKKIAAKFIRLISNRFFNAEETIFKTVMTLIDFETGGLGKTTIRVKELKDGKLVEKLITDKEELLEILFLPLQEFEERYKGLVDENGIEHNNNALIKYREKVHKKYEIMAGRIVALGLIGFTLGVVSNILGNLGANAVTALF